MRFFPATPAPDVHQVKLAWRDFIEHGNVESDRVRPHILRAWKRAYNAGCDPHQARADVLPALDTIALLKHQTGLVDVASPFLSALSRAAGNERHAAMLSDGSGRVLKIVADQLTVEDPDFPRAGSLLSEAVAGANGIGTALAENHYVELVGPEHYIEGFHVFTCQGVPLAGPAGQVAGVLSMSVRRPETASKVRDVLFCASEAAECELLAANLSKYLVTAARSQPVIEGLRQDIIQGITQARLQIELAAYNIADSKNPAISLDTAYQLSLRFKRQASVWRDLADQATGAAEPILLAELADDFIGLMETEARVANVKILHARMERAMVLDDKRSVSQQLLTAFLSAMQSVQPAGEIRVNVRSEEFFGLVQLEGVSPTGNLIQFEIRTPLLRAAEKRDIPTGTLAGH